MWKSSDDPNPSPSPRPQDRPASPGRSESPPAGAAARSGAAAAVIGPSISVKGEVSGSEDLRIEGEIDGKVALQNNTVLVGSGGEVRGEIEAKVVEIEGKVEGDVDGSERIVIRRSARVRGDLATPRVVIEDGARFKGTIDMEFEGEGKRASSAPASRPTPLDRPRDTGSPGSPGSSKEGDKGEDKGAPGSSEASSSGSASPLKI